MNNISNFSFTDTSINNYIKYIEKKNQNKYSEQVRKKDSIQVGDIIRLAYLIPEGDKERTQYYEGLIIAIKNYGLGKTFTLRRSVQNIGIEQIFLLNSPKIISITKKQSSKVRRAKLYFIRNLQKKSTRLKIKF
jgi:large subunit ribosomal protein L19